MTQSAQSVVLGAPGSSTEIVRTDRLTKRYGQVHALTDFDLSVDRGEIYGLLGPNGAGKTTVMRLLLDLIRPTGGRISLFGERLTRHSVALRARIGYLPGELTLYPDLTGIELLRLFAALRGHHDLDHAHGLADRFALDLRRRIKELSGGNRQKLGIVQAFAHRPELTILDEPATGLDPLAQGVLHDYLRDYSAAGGTVLFSSHVLSEVEQVADRVGIVLIGRLALAERVDVLKASAMREFDLTFAEPVGQEHFAHLPGVRELRVTGTTVHCRVSGSVGDLVRAASLLPLINIVSHEPDLQDIFLDYVRKSGSPV